MPPKATRDLTTAVDVVRANMTSTPTALPHVQPIPHTIGGRAGERRKEESRLSLLTNHTRPANPTSSSTSTPLAPRSPLAPFNPARHQATQRQLRGRERQSAIQLPSCATDASGALRGFTAGGQRPRVCFFPVRWADFRRDNTTRVNFVVLLYFPPNTPAGALMTLLIG